MDLAFNKGSDARLGGWSKASNPYSVGSAEWMYWGKGWADVEKFWGKWAKWPVIPLRKVRR